MGWLLDKAKDQSLLAKDPEKRFTELVNAFAPPALAPEALKGVIDSKPSNVVDALSVEIAKSSQLTQAAAKPIVQTAFNQQADAQTNAQAVSQAVSTAVSVQASVKLSDPVMLAPWFRAGGALGLVVIALICALNIDSVATAKAVSGTAVVSQAVVAVLALIGMLVLVMGYKNVTIQASPPSSGS